MSINPAFLTKRNLFEENNYNGEFQDFYFDMMLLPEVEPIILENPNLIEDFDKNSDSYPFMYFYFGLITGKVKINEIFDSIQSFNMETNEGILSYQFLKKCIEKLIPFLEKDIEAFVSFLGVKDINIVHALLEYYSKQDEKIFFKIFQILSTKVDEKFFLIDRYFDDPRVISYSLENQFWVMKIRRFYHYLFKSTEENIKKFFRYLFEGRYKYQSKVIHCFSAAFKSKDSEYFKTVTHILNDFFDEILKSSTSFDRILMIENMINKIIKIRISKSFEKLFDFYLNFAHLSHFKMYSFYEDEYILKDFIPDFNGLVMKTFLILEGKTVVKNPEKYALFINASRRKQFFIDAYAEYFEGKETLSKERQMEKFMMQKDIEIEEFKRNLDHFLFPRERPFLTEILTEKFKQQIQQDLEESILINTGEELKKLRDNLSKKISTIF